MIESLARSRVKIPSITPHAHKVDFHGKFWALEPLPCARKLVLVQKRVAGDKPKFLVPGVGEEDLVPQSSPDGSDIITDWFPH
jgi:hypothetical protein